MRLKILVLLIPTVLYSTGYLLLNLYGILGVCIGENTGVFNDQIICYTNPTEVGRAIQTFAPFLFLSTLLFLPLPKKSLISWYKNFVAWGLGIGVLIFLLVQADIRSYFSFIVNPTWVYVIYGIIFTVLSLLFAAFSLKRK